VPFWFGKGIVADIEKERRAAMLFITLLSPKGKRREVIDYLKELKAPQGVAIHDVYFTFGRYAGLIVFDAPDVRTAMKFVMEVGFATDYTVETLTAVPAEQL